MCMPTARASSAVIRPSSKARRSSPVAPSAMSGGNRCRRRAPCRRASAVPPLERMPGPFSMSAAMRSGTSASSWSMFSLAATSSGGADRDDDRRRRPRPTTHWRRLLVRRRADGEVLAAEPGHDRSARPSRGASGARAVDRPRRPRGPRARARSCGTAAQAADARSGDAATGGGGSYRSPGCGRGSRASQSTAVPAHARGQPGFEHTKRMDPEWGKLSDWRERAQRLALVLAMGVWAGCGAGGERASRSSRRGAGRREPAPAVRLGIDVLQAQGAGPIEGMRVGLDHQPHGQGRARADHDRLAARESADRAGGALQPGARDPGRSGPGRAGVERPGRGDGPADPLALRRDPRADGREMLEGARRARVRHPGHRHAGTTRTCGHMALAMRAAAQHGMRFVVLDRPNPIGGEQVQGNDAGAGARDVRRAVPGAQCGTA